VLYLTQVSIGGAKSSMAESAFFFKKECALLGAGVYRRREEQHGLLHPAQNRALSERCALGESAFFFFKNTFICVCVSVCGHAFGAHALSMRLFGAHALGMHLFVSVFRCACVGHALLVRLSCFCLGWTLV